MKNCGISVTVTFLLVVFGGTGCVRLQPQPDLSRFYVLAVPERGEGAKPAELELSRPIFLGRVEAPAYLNETRIATRAGESGLEYSGRHHWAEPVRDGVTRVLREALVRRVGEAGVHPGTLRRPSGEYFEVQVTLTRFEWTSDFEAHLGATWQVVAQPERQIKVTRYHECRRTFGAMADDYGPGVAALDECLDALAAEIVEGLKVADGV